MIHELYNWAFLDLYDLMMESFPKWLMDILWLDQNAILGRVYVKYAQNVVLHDCGPFLDKMGFGAVCSSTHFLLGGGSSSFQSS